MPDTDYPAPVPPPRPLLPIWLAGGTLLFALLATGGLWYQATLAGEARMRSEFAFQARYQSGEIVRRMATYHQVLRGVRASLHGALPPSPEMFREHVAALRLDEHYPGIQGIGFAQVIPAPELPGHLVQMRADGFPEYRAWPEGRRELLTAITRIEPFDRMNARAIGYDMFSEPVRREAMARARDSGRAALSGKVTLVQELPTNVQAGTLLYLPVYRRGMPVDSVEQRRAAILGWVYAPFRIGDLMSSLEAGRYRDIDVSLYDGEQASPGSCLYGCAAGGETRAGLAATSTVRIAGRPWVIDMRAAPAFMARAGSDNAWLIAAGGTFASVLLALLVWLLGSSRQRALALATRMTAELRASGKALEAAQRLESIGMLTGGVAHDFNNVLQIISGNVQLMLRIPGTPEQREKRLNSIAGAVERGAKLSSQLLAFARRQQLRPEAVNMHHLLVNVDDLLQRAIGVEVTLKVAAAPGLWDVLVDPAQLENVILNLAINARDAMQGRGRLDILLSNVEIGADAAATDLPAGEYVRLLVRDNGPGMPPEVRARAFEPFFTTKAEGQGSGLGLSTAYGFVKQSGGHIEIDSAPGKGTQVTILLPRSYQAPLASAVAGTPAEVAAGRGETILVVDDDLPVQEAAADMLVELGYRVVRADDGAGALEALGRGDAVDLLFSDVVMPGPVSSTELVREATARFPGLPVLLASGYSRDMMDRVRDIMPGIHLLAKPYRREELGARVRYLLDMRNAAG